jgi:serine protease
VQLANGGGGVSPVLGLSSTSVLLNNNNTAISVAVSNVGAGLLELTTLNISTQTGGSWLSANSVPIQNPTSSDSSSIEIQANITGLLDGVYSGAVEVVSNGGTRTIAISLALSSAGGGGETHEVFVLAISTDTLTTIAQEVVQSPNVLGYAFSGLTPGSYFVVAGTDADDDGFICDEGEPLCGIYPSAEGPIALTVTAGGNLTAVDFPLLSTFTGSAASTSDRTGYQLLQATESPASQIP